MAYKSSKVQTNSVIYLDTGLPSLSSGWPMKSDAKYKVDHNGIEQSLSGYRQSYCTNEPVYVHSCMHWTVAKDTYVQCCTAAAPIQTTYMASPTWV